MRNVLIIVAQAIRMLMHDPAETLRVTLPGLGVWMAGQIYVIVISALAAAPSTGIGVHEIIAIPFFALGSVWMAVAWHRHVLIVSDEDPHLEPMSGSMLLRYFGVTMLIALIVMGALLLALALLLAVVSSTNIFSTPLSQQVVAVVAGASVFWLMTRLALPLPAIALGTRLSFRESLRETKPISSGLLIFSGAFALITIVLEQLVGASAPVFAWIIATAFELIGIYVGASLLTTLYGVLIQGRDLPGFSLAR